MESNEVKWDKIEWNIIKSNEIQYYKQRLLIFNIFERIMFSTSASDADSLSACLTLLSLQNVFVILIFGLNRLN